VKGASLRLIASLGALPFSLSHRYRDREGGGRAGGWLSPGYRNRRLPPAPSPGAANGVSNTHTRTPLCVTSCFTCLLYTLLCTRVSCAALWAPRSHRAMCMSAEKLAQPLSHLRKSDADPTHPDCFDLTFL